VSVIAPAPTSRHGRKQHHKAKDAAGQALLPGSEREVGPYMGTEGGKRRLLPPWRKAVKKNLLDPLGRLLKDGVRGRHRHRKGEERERTGGLFMGVWARCLRLSCVSLSLMALAVACMAGAGTHHRGRTGHTGARLSGLSTYDPLIGLLSLEGLAHPL
jgi:hypothetical protein